MIVVYLIGIVVILLAALFTFLTAALSAISNTQLLLMMEKGEDAAQRIHNWRHQLDLSTTALFIAQTLTQTIGGIWLGLAMFMSTHSIIAVVIGSLLFYFLFLFAGRILPRILGTRLANKIVKFTAGSVSTIVFILRPLASLVQYVNSSLTPDVDDDEASREEIDEILETAHEEGSLATEEYRILKSIMRYSDVQVSDVMTPRTVMFSCSADMTIEEAIRQPELTQYSRFPVWEDDSLDAVVGYVLTRDALRAMVDGKSNGKLRDIAREVYFIPENIQLDRALENFLERREHLFVVVDEYGGVEGLITMEDVVETILGVEIVDEADNVIDLRQLAKQRRDKRIATAAHIPPLRGESSAHTGKIISENKKQP